jgi:hypothetical protein
MRTCRYNWAVEIKAEKMFPRFSFVPPTCRQRQTNCYAHERVLGSRNKVPTKRCQSSWKLCVSCPHSGGGNAQRTQANGKMTQMNLNFVLCQNQYFFSQYIVKVLRKFVIWHSFIGFEQGSYTWYINFCCGVHKVSNSVKIDKIAKKVR